MAIVVDCDSHIMEPADLWQTYLEPKYRDRAIRIERIDGVEHLIIGEITVLAGGLAGLGGAHLDRKAMAGLTYADGCETASYEPAARTQLLDAWGVDVGVLFPTIGILPFPISDQDLGNAYCRAYNRWQLDFMRASNGRVAAIALINWHDVDQAVLELTHCLKAGFKGVFVPPEVIGDIRPSQPHFDPIWRRVEEAGAAACMHVIVRFTGGGAFGSWGGTRPGPTFSFAMGATGQLIPCLAAMVTDQLFERFPRLKMVSVEAGCGWAAYLMDRLDEKYALVGQTTPMPMKPSDYIRRNCWFVAEPEERTIGAMLDLVGEDKILWGSDYPHIDSTLEAPNLIRASIAQLSPQRQAAVLGENARALFNL